MTILSLINILGTIAFSVSGVYAGLQKKLDLFGIVVIAFVTAIGGGTIRDMLLGHPVKWIADESVIYLILVTSVLAILGRKYLHKLNSPLQLFDALGLGCFFVLGFEQGMSASLPILSCIIIGTITACFGGVIRDILLNEIPFLFRKEIYATACILGGFIHALLLKTGEVTGYINIITMLVIFSIRIVSLRYNISLPKSNMSN
ncbi:trimeric intracellular cation channel family protein [Flectobacillus major]|uniref:trimeric intracellular cation channel family protein n=1 Tax=Flectobacillus major TaxID=103 RepID=UPI00041E0D22|nr:trimeric intracellular cation channel family protein [Flectobacillus major]